MKEKELLAPAGSKESLIAAVQAGADAVYLSGKSFGARQFAANFDMEEMAEAIRYCHIRNVKVYVTVNTLIKETELQSAIDYVGDLYAMDVDAIIIQDIGLLKRVKASYPDFECHASTQMTLHNVDDVRAAQALGLKRVVLARELSIKEIQHIIDETAVEVETFIHGALCISYSGQCLMSSMIGGRSGNRGRCAQACRKKYQLVRAEATEEREALAEGYLLSPKDLSASVDFESLMTSDVYSFKIEGRMKGPEYTYQVVSVYRKLMDEAYANEGCISKVTLEEAGEQLKKVFNRDFTKGLLLGDTQDKRMSLQTPSNKGYLLGRVVKYDIKRQQLEIRLSEGLSVGDDVQIRRGDESVGARVEHVFIDGAKEKVGEAGQVVRIPFRHKAFTGESVYKTFDKLLAQEISQWLDKEHIAYPVDMHLTLKEGAPAVFGVSDDRGNCVTLSSEVPVEKALKVALSQERVEEQLNKIGDYPYRLGRCVVDMGTDVTIAIKVINQLRREALDALSEIRAISYKDRSKNRGVHEQIRMHANEGGAENVMASRDGVELVCSVSTLEQLAAVIANGIKTVYYKDMSSAEEAYQYCLEAGVDYYFHSNRILHDEALSRTKALLQNQKDAGLVAGHIGGSVQCANRKVRGDYSLNIMNSSSMDYFLSEGYEGLHVSPELTADEIKLLKTTSVATELTVFGRQILMTMNYCPVKTGGKCLGTASCTLSDYGLVDEKGMFFPLYGMDCQHVQVLNGPYLNLIEQMDKFSELGIVVARIEFYNEDRAFVNGVLSMFQKALSNTDYENDEAWLKKTYDTSYTNGHFKRGVE
ncbi:MAG: U32 family peptidase [Clostridia bacterium]|nr:U32 family peptidase [Clostridia bacterium]